VTFRGSYSCGVTHHTDDGCSKHLWNVRQLQRDYTAQYPRRLSSLFSSFWQPEVSLAILLFKNDFISHKSYCWQHTKQKHKNLYLDVTHFYKKATKVILLADAFKRKLMRMLSSSGTNGTSLKVLLEGSGFLWQIDKWLPKSTVGFICRQALLSRTT
jgi:hypothetical protein